MNTSGRLHSIDSARALALLLGIVLHTTMSFFLGLPARDSSQSVTLAVTFFVIHIFRMSLFFLIAGYFGHLAFHRKGLRGFLKDRAQRVLVPLTAGWAILAPPTIAAILWGLSRTYPDGAPEGFAAPAPQAFPLVHLWFLYYLCLLYASVLLLRAGFVATLDRSGLLRQRIDSWIARSLASRAALLALALPTVAMFYLARTWAVWFGIPTPDTGLMPQIPALVAYGTAFAFGWLLQRQVGLLELFARQWRSNVALAVGLTVTCLAIVGLTPVLEAPTALSGGAAMRWAYAAAYALAIWTWTFGFLGAAVRFGSAESAVRRYIADAAYWFYLVHPPIVFGLQVLFMDLPLSWAVKFPAILALTMGILFATYHFLVRPTFVGELLNGRKYPRLFTSATPNAKASEGPQELARSSTPAAVAEDVTPPIAELTNVTKQYGTSRALDGLSLAVRPGELLAVLGPNGAGKSTAIGLWLGLLEPDSGGVTVFGGSPLESASRLGVGVMMQEVALAPMLTGRELVALTASAYRDPLPVDEAVALTATEALAGRRYGKLSAGQKRQVQFAIAVCGRPSLLFLDEPTVGLDVQAREAMWRTIRRLRDHGCAIVLTTHYLEEAEALADRVVVLAKGRQIAEGSVDEMRALVSRKRVRCVTSLPLDEIRRWPGVIAAERLAGTDAGVEATTADAEGLVRRWLAADPQLSRLEVEQASLADAFTELTQEAA
jgi:ABC-type multidrug transport system ATPase subunit